VSFPDRIAVLISTYNAPAFLRLTLEGWRAQHDTRFTLYIADDGSAQQTADLIDEFKHDFPVPIVHVWHEDRGFRKARVHNMALAQVEEPYILLTDGDCIPLPQMVATHLRLAESGSLISGSRVLLSKGWTERLCAGEHVDTGASLLYWLARRLHGDINRLFPILLPTRLGGSHQRLSGIRGCHLSCWRDDLLHVNGFDESFEGWGREDSDLVARLFHAGVMRRDLRGMPVLHLWHEEYSRGRLDRNDALLETCLREKRIRAMRGMAELSEDAHA